MWKSISIPVPELSDHYVTYSPDQGQRIISPGSASKKFPSGVTHWDFLQAAPNSEITESPATYRKHAQPAIALADLLPILNKHLQGHVVRDIFNDIPQQR